MAVNGGHAGTKKGPNWGHVMRTSQRKRGGSGPSGIRGANATQSGHYNFKIGACSSFSLRGGVSLHLMAFRWVDSLDKAACKLFAAVLLLHFLGSGKTRWCSVSTAAAYSNLPPSLRVWQLYGKGQLSRSWLKSVIRDWVLQHPCQLEAQLSTTMTDTSSIGFRRLLWKLRVGTPPEM